MVSSQNEVNKNKLSAQQMFLNTREGKPEVDTYHMPSLCSSISIETSHIYVYRISGYLSGLYISYVEEWGSYKIQEKRIIASDIVCWSQMKTDIVIFP